MSDNNISADQQFIIDELAAYFDNDNWNYEYHEDNQVFTGEISLDGPLGSVKFVMFANEDHAVCYHILPITARPQERPAQAEFLTRVNYNLAQGSFQLDFSDGEIRYKHRASLADLRANSYESISYLLGLGCSMIEQYSPGIVAISFGQSPEKAYLKCRCNITDAKDDEDED